MCTAIIYRPDRHYLGRTLDLEGSFGEVVAIAPRGFAFGDGLDTGFAMIGVAHTADGYPLYYDAVNEKGLCMAALNFPDYARYGAPAADRENVPSYALIPWVLRRCETAREAAALLGRVNVTGEAFNARLPVTPLHWFLADGKESFAAEPLEDGLRILENPADVLTNSPPLEFQLRCLEQLRNLTAGQPENRFAPGLPLGNGGRGLGAIGLPGDWSSASRFARVAFVLHNAPETCSAAPAAQVFRMLAAVAQPEGCSRLSSGGMVRTVYTVCCDAARGVYYYETYGDSGVRAVELRRTDLDGCTLEAWPLRQEWSPPVENAGS